MPPHPPRPSGTIGWMIVLGLGFVGCGPEQKTAVPLFPVHGTVTLDGKPLAGADLRFIPEGETPGQGGAARTAPDGTYTLSTPLGEPGAPAGDYRVVIEKHEAPPGAGPPDPNVPPIESAFRELLPPSYSDPAQSTLKATVTPSGSTTADFALKSAPRPAGR
jgi:hypothetical protein